MRMRNQTRTLPSYVMASSEVCVQVVDLPEFTMASTKVLLVKRHVVCHNRVDLCETTTTTELYTRFVFLYFYYLRSMTTGIDKDGRRVKELLKPLNKDELKELFAELGLYEATLRNKYSDSRAAYLDDLIGLWILRRNAVSERGGATWGSLKKALQILDHNQISANIPVSTAGKTV